ncbi:hypothetical protein ScPMuIL_013637 [Solemya velum]
MSGSRSLKSVTTSAFTPALSPLTLEALIECRSLNDVSHPSDALKSSCRVSMTLNNANLMEKMENSKEANKQEQGENGIACQFCLMAVDDPETYGKSLFQHGIRIHYFCMLFSSGLCQRGKTEKQGILGFLPEDILKEKRRGCRLKCSYCKKGGATIGCVVKNCRRAFHLPCGKENGTLHQYFDTYRSYCPEHRPKQPQPVSDRLAFYGTANTTCAICLNSVEARTSDQTLRSPCCRNSWFHRNCVQRFATSAGLYFFKCPLCNNKDSFQDEMLNMGIYIPDQDAAWETEPNAFVELLERYTHCDALLCRCPDGRDYNKDGSKWEIIVCDWCGSKATHIHCHALKKIGKEDVCLECKDIGDKVSSQKRKKSTPKKTLSTPPRSNVQQKGKSDYPGPSKKLHKTSLPLLEDGEGNVTRISDAETDAELDVCGVVRESQPRSRARRKRYKGSLDRLHSAKKKRKVSSQISDMSVCLDTSVVTEPIIQQNVGYKSKCKKARYKKRGSLDEVAAAATRRARVKARLKKKFALGHKESSGSFDGSQQMTKSEKSSTITSAEDLVLIDFSKDYSQRAFETTDINSNVGKFYFDPQIDTHDVDCGMLPLQLELSDTESVGGDPPVLSPPILGGTSDESFNVSCKFEDLPPLLIPEENYKSKIPQNDPCAIGNRQSPRLSANKKLQRRKSAMEKMKSSKISKEKRPKSSKPVKNQPSIMKWFHINRAVADECCSDQDVTNIGEKVIQSRRKAGQSPSQICEESPCRNSPVANRQKEKKTLVIKWRDKQIIVKPTGKEIVTMSGRKIASSKSTRTSIKPICAVAPSPRSRASSLPETSPRSRSVCPTDILPIDVSCQPLSLGVGRFSLAERSERTNPPGDRKHAICCPISVSSPAPFSSSTHDTGKALTASERKGESAINGNLMTLSVGEHPMSIDGDVWLDSPKAKCSLVHRYSHVDNAPSTAQTEVSPRSQFCSATPHSFEYKPVSRSVIMTSDDKYSALETSETEEDLEISFKSDIPFVEDTREVVFSRQSYPADLVQSEDRDILDSIDGCMNGAPGEGWKFLDLGGKYTSKLGPNFVVPYSAAS